MRVFKKLALSLGLAAAALAPTMPSVAAEVTTLRFSQWMPPGHFIVTNMFEPWAQEVEKATEGRVKVEFINALGKPQAHLDLVRNGIADMGMSVHSYTANRFPLIEFAELPFTTDDGGVNSVAYWRTYEKFMMGANEHRGVKLLGMWTSPATVIFTSQDNVQSIDDLKGKKLRSPSPLFDAIGKALGIVTVNAPASDSYEMLSRGVIDGMYFQYDQLDNWKLDKLVKTAVSVEGGFGKSSQYMFMNERKWKSLSEADRAAIEKISGEWIANDFGSKWQVAEQQAIEKHTAAGLKTLRIEGAAADQLKERLAFVEEDWIKAADKKGIDGKAALAYFREQIKELSAAK
ncbi:TRAP transporter substrate-binding protein [Alcaligenes nematophilus]|uniref:ABC transporter substrate-binding protein n=2 Tax=Alcaligenes TaxID=507 RepID=A0A0A2N8U3_ALCFA|nr:MULTISPECIES: TRAP transporter substrate-binding protein [Alcaligenes]MDH4867523.1 TRAP transporter substrate-binding protein [Bacillus cereus]ALO38615.1 ABC transporter substrate-binding protein [Alcaligenes faecalis]ASC90503.1 ABC transporter substrate-binding protein [Alcaligenes faecalis]ATI01504.1 ABC transporter substrate-binding protein [Alcaligenes faecalis]AYZ90859.1 TRAP transporter substrate-binding protein [Alcaligenes faecalis]